MKKEKKELKLESEFEKSAAISFCNTILSNNKLLNDILDESDGSESPYDLITKEAVNMAKSLSKYI